MKTKTVVIIIVSIILIISTIFIINYLQKKKYDKPFIEYEYPETINVLNESIYERADTLILSLAHQIFKFDTLRVNLYMLPKHMKSNEIDYYAIVQKINFNRHSYKIFLNDNLSFEKLKQTLCHEFVHIKQYEDLELLLFEDYVVYKGMIITNDVEYEEREWEIEAFNLQHKLYKELNSILYEN